MMKWMGQWRKRYKGILILQTVHDEKHEFCLWICKNIDMHFEKENIQEKHTAWTWDQVYEMCIDLTKDNTNTRTL